MQMIIAILLSMSILTSCQGSKEDAPGEQYLPEKNLVNVLYGKDSLQNMDVYLPAGRSTDSTKVIILIHGGGWNGGHKSEFHPYIDSFKTRLPGYAIFNLSYRLVRGGNLFPTQEMDIREALDHITEQAAQYGINKDQMVMLGISAGGHLALLQSYKYNKYNVRAVVSFFGPTDLLTMYKRPWHPMVPFALQMITGTTPTANAEIYRSSSPINFVKRTSPPTLLLHGTRDQVVDITQSRILVHKLVKEGVPNELVEYEGLGHGWQGRHMQHSFDKIQSFLETHVP
jgi:acetyl esterase/lipase